MIGKWLPPRDPRIFHWLRVARNDPAEAVTEVKVNELQNFNPTLSRNKIQAALLVYKLDFETTRKFLARNNTSSLDGANDGSDPLTASFNTLNVDTRFLPDIHEDSRACAFRANADADSDSDSPDENHVRCLATAYLRTCQKG